MDSSKNKIICELVDSDRKPRVSLIEEKASILTREDIQNGFSDDPWLENIVLNIWEYVHGKSVLESLPWNITLPIADICNARCTFCDSWLRGKGFLGLEQARRYEEILPYAYHFGYQGHGEPLASPYIKELLKYFGRKLNSRCFTYTITNGLLIDTLLDELYESKMQLLNVSLNATTPEIHEKVMGMGRDSFDRVIKILKYLSSQPSSQIKFTISMVLTSDNFHQGADFVKLGNDLGADTIYLRTLLTNPQLPPGLNYHLLAPDQHPEFEFHKANILKAIESSKVRVEAQPETWKNDSVTPDIRKRILNSRPREFSRREARKDPQVRQYYRRSKGSSNHGSGKRIQFTDDLVENPYNRTSPFNCKFVYYNLISTVLTWDVVPCCYMPVVPGHEKLLLDDNKPFRELWNCDAFINLRTRLKQGPLFQACALCPMQGG